MEKLSSTNVSFRRLPLPVPHHERASLRRGYRRPKEARIDALLEIAEEAHRFEVDRKPSSPGNVSRRRDPWPVHERRRGCHGRTAVHRFILGQRSAQSEPTSLLGQVTFPEGGRRVPQPPSRSPDFRPSFFDKDSRPVRRQPCHSDDQGRDAMEGHQPCDIGQADSLDVPSCCAVALQQVQASD